MAKKHYVRMTVDPIFISMENGFLAGSVTAAPLTIDHVTVEDYTSGFDSGGTTFHNDFENIGFD